MPDKKNRKKYQRVLSAFLSRRDEVEYDKDNVFDAATVSTITEEEVVQWLTYKAYGIDVPSEDDFPIHCRSSTIHFHKKAISYFIPNKHFKWNVEHLAGNPTMSPAISALIRCVKKHEVRGEGVPSEARRAFLPDESRLVLRIAERCNSVFALQLTTMAKFQVHLIARIDVTAHVKLSELKVHSQFDFALSVRLRWTKNCLEERHAPDQIILGAMDSDYCLIAALSIYLQHAYKFTNASRSEFFFCDSDKTPDTVKAQVSGLLTRRVLNSDEWEEHQQTQGRNDNDETNNCGTHSYRLGGRSQDEVDCRGRWRDTQRVSDRYTSITLPFIDANVASTLCVGGPAKYEPKADSGITDHWLVSDFVPHIAAKLGNRVAILLGKALLWCLKEPLMMFSMPDCLRARLDVTYVMIQRLEDEVNPIDRIPLAVYPSNGQLRIDLATSLFAATATAGAEGEGGGTAAPAFQIVGDSQQALLSQNHAIRGRLEEVYTTVQNNNESMVQNNKLILKHVLQIANRPAQINHGYVRKVATVVNNDDAGDGNENDNRQQQLYEGTLSKHPKNLHRLWEE